MSLITELKRRNVFRVAMAYLVIAWLLAQVSATLENALNMPAWFDTMVVSLLMIGFPIALFFSWVFEITPDGIKREKDIKRDESIAHETSKKLNVVTLVAAFAVLGMFLWQQFVDEGEQATVIPQTIETKIANETEQPSEILNNKSIAVLPFTNMANNPESEPITLGLHDDLLTHISKISALKVISRTSVLEYKDTTKKIKQIAEELGVANILEGGVQRAGNQIRINVQLIDAQTDEHLWAEIYDHELTASNIFKVQTEISKKIAAALKAQLSPEEEQSLARQDTDNIEAYNAYLSGRQLILNRNSEELKKALQQFERATELDPNYAQAYVGQALTWDLLNAYSDVSSQDKFEYGEPLIEKALSINPKLALAHAVKGLYLLDKGLFEEAESSYQHAVKLNPNEASAYHWYGEMLTIFLSRPEEALVQIEKAAELNPLSPVIQDSLGTVLLALDRVDEALEQYKFLYDFAPEYQGGPAGLSRIYQKLGQFDWAVKWQKEVIERDQGNVNEYEQLAYLYLNLNAASKATEVADKIGIQFPNSVNHKRLLGLIALYEGNHKRSIELATEITKTEANPVYEDFKWRMIFAARNFREYSEYMMTQLEHVSEQWVPVEINNALNFMQLYWSLRQLSQNKQAQIIMEQLQSSQKNWLNGRNYNLAFLAIQGQHEVAVNYFTEMVTIGETSFWWFILDNPIFDEMKKTPTFEKAYQQLMDELSKQRENLEKMESEIGAIQ